VPFEDGLKAAIAQQSDRELSLAGPSIAVAPSIIEDYDTSGRHSLN